MSENPENHGNRETREHRGPNFLRPEDQKPGPGLFSDFCTRPGLRPQLRDNPAKLFTGINSPRNCC